MTKEKHTIFCYGTLKRDHRANYLLGEHSEFVSPARTHSRYQLYDVGGFPGMIEAEETSADGVAGEIFVCDDSTMARLDTYECVSSGLFTRGEVELDDGSTAEAYFYTGSHLRDLTPDRRIMEGVWE
jgi:gamma-glutamylaminecyclotransferase